MRTAKCGFLLPKTHFWWIIRIFFVSFFSGTMFSYFYGENGTELETEFFFPVVET